MIKIITARTIRALIISGRRGKIFRHSKTSRGFAQSHVLIKSMCGIRKSPGFFGDL